MSINPVKTAVINIEDSIAHADLTNYGSDTYRHELGEVDDTFIEAYSEVLLNQGYQVSIVDTTKPDIM